MTMLYSIEIKVVMISSNSNGKVGFIIRQIIEKRIAAPSSNVIKYITPFILLQSNYRIVLNYSKG
jgi:hypothetical protein